MQKHQTRLWTILALVVAAGGAILGLEVTDTTSSLMGPLQGALAILVPALWDALAVDRKRKRGDVGEDGV